jgi:glutathione synthase/RimK-type ligase-like ATP-grasp enzyme
MSVDCILATCEIVPALDPDDRMLVHELRKRGLTVSTAVWSDPYVDWGAARLCMVRSTWDYHRRYREFAFWIERVASLTVIRNDARLLQWNAHKSYLLDLERLGVPVVPTVWAQRGERRRLSELREARGWRDIVLKPARGAAAHDVTLVRGDAASLALGQERLDTMLHTEDALIQPYLEAVVAYGERALIFLNGRFSHAVVKKPFDRILVVGHEPSSVVEATGEEINVATQAMAAVPGRPIYARVDLLNDGEGHPRVSEVELIEPGLYLSVYEPARRAFADAVEGELELI